MTISSSTGIWAIGTNWPWPQIVFTKYYNLAIAAKADGDVALYEMTNYDDEWIAEEKVNFGIQANIKSISIADFITYYVVTVEEYIHGVADHNVYYKNIASGAVTTFPGSFPAAATCCNFNGQLILGQIRSSSAPWKDIPKCSVIWSDIGSVEMNPEDYIVAGYAAMEWGENNNGKVYKVLSLGKMVRVYGDKGICNLVPYSVERVTGFGVSILESPGILSADSVDGDESTHGYVDSNYDWWVVSGEKAVNLGYRDFMKTLTNRIFVRYDQRNKKFYISDGVYCYIYSKHGMYSSHQCMTGIGYYKDTMCGFVKDNEDNKIRLVTASFDFGHQSMQTIEAIETGIVYDTVADETIYGALSVKYDYKGDFIQLAYNELNEQGILTQKVTGREFKISLQGTYENDAKFSLNSLLAKLKFSDKRNIRGRLNVN